MIYYNQSYYSSMLKSQSLCEFENCRHAKKDKPTCDLHFPAETHCHQISGHKSRDSDSLSGSTGA